MSEILICNKTEQFAEALPEVGKGILALFQHLPADEVQPYADRLVQASKNNPNYLLKKDDIPPTAEKLAKMVAVQNGYRQRPKWKMTGRPRIFGVKQPISGAHIDTNHETDADPAVAMPLYGSWLQYTGGSKISLKQLDTFDTQEMNEIIDEYVAETNDPRVELDALFKQDKLGDLSQIDIYGPYFGVWAVGMSERKGVHTVVHQVETIQEPRISTTLIQSYTDRDY